MSDDVVFRILVGSLKDRKAALMEFAKEAWTRGWDDCFEATQEALKEIGLAELVDLPKSKYVQ